jgi:hypothetical protein
MLSDGSSASAVFTPVARGEALVDPSIGAGWVPSAAALGASSAVTSGANLEKGDKTERRRAHRAACSSSIALLRCRRSAVERHRKELPLRWSRRMGWENGAPIVFAIFSWVSNSTVYDPNS